MRHRSYFRRRRHRQVSMAAFIQVHLAPYLPRYHLPAFSPVGFNPLLRSKIPFRPSLIKLTKRIVPVNCHLDTLPYLQSLPLVPLGPSLQVGYILVPLSRPNQNCVI